MYDYDCDIIDEGDDDWCAAAGYYDDGVCDTDCPLYDYDCD